MNLKPFGKNRYLIEKHGGMNVDAVVYLSRSLYRDFCEGEALNQLVNAAKLPGTCFRVVGLPDIHTGFGMPIGGVMATDAETGVVSAGAVGMDINCGVRLVASTIERERLTRELIYLFLERLETVVPTGVGQRTRFPELTRKVHEVWAGGARKIIEMGYGYEGEHLFIEEGGCLKGADADAVTGEAAERADQLCTLGGGNHFIELGAVAEVYDEKLAERFGLFRNMVTVMIHTGSRGFGHQICVDYSKLMVAAAKRYGIELPDRGLACVPISSREGKDYLSAMACAVNFAFANRQLIAYHARRVLAEILKQREEELGLKTVYDVAHNIAKFEDHGGRRVLVHRKGATRALPPGHPANPPVYMNTGHPALIPGSMGTESYVVVGTELAAETFYSVNHGAGRVLSRAAARKTFSPQQLQELMGDVVYDRKRAKELLDEAPAAYKPIGEVVDTLAEIGITRKVARITPLAVIKGAD